MMARRTKAQIAQLEAQIADVLKEDHPQSVRHIFYRMTDPRLPEPVEKTEHGYKQLQFRVTEMRRAKTLPYGWIADATRSGLHVYTFDEPGDLIYTYAARYRDNVWRESNEHVEVWCESRSIAGVIKDVCRQYAVTLYPSGGFSSMTLAFEAAGAINASGKSSAAIIYVGDYDPAGVLIDQSIEHELRTHLPGFPLTMNRIAVNELQIAEMDLPTKPRKQTDRRRLDIKETVEAEAIPAGTMRQMVADAVQRHLPSDVDLDTIAKRDKAVVGQLARLGVLVDMKGMAESLTAIADLENK